MLSNESFEQWCQQLKLSEQARTIIARIRTSPPSRRVQGRAGNVSGQYPSRKMGFGIQFESRRNELAAITLMEHDPTVLEYYDQPERIKLTYQGPHKRVGVWHTPDFFVLRSDGVGWLECKMGEALLRFAEHHSPRYVPTPDGNWTCPPGVAYAQSVGLSYWLRSSREANPVYFDNLCKRYYDRRPHATRKSEPLPQESAMLERKIKRAEEGRCIPWHFEMKFAPGS